MKAGSKLMWLILLLYAVSIGMDLFPPFFQQIYTDDIITGKNPSWFEPLLWVFAALFVLELIAWVVLNSHRRTLSMHFSLVSQSRYVWHVLRLPMSAFSRFSTGDLMARYMSISRVGVKLFDQAPGVVLCLGALFILDGELTPGMLLASQAFMSSMLYPVTKLSNVMQEVFKAHSVLERQEEVLECETVDISGLPREEDSVKLRGEIELRNVTFGYDRSQPPLIRHLPRTGCQGRHL
jgi:ABC-type bacteriocin/lantibiotic exporter with double-glycine peptidase domain